MFKRMFWLLLLWICLLLRAQAGESLQVAAVPQVEQGQSATQLPDGRWLLLGGISKAGRAVSNGILVDDKGRHPLVGAMHEARKHHSATLLPDGSVLVLGGANSEGILIASAELLDLQTGKFKLITEPGTMARASHTATVLTDGRLLIAGGIDQSGGPVRDAELYDPVARQVERFNPVMEAARYGHVARLLADQNVLLWTGAGSHGEPLTTGELYLLSRQRFEGVDAATTAEIFRSSSERNPPGVSATEPQAYAQNARVDRPLMVHFRQRMQPASLSEGTVTLIGPHGPVPARIVPVEYGTLLFITPREDLLPGSEYTLFISGATDVFGQALPFTAIGFVTAPLAEQQQQMPPAQGNALDEAGLSSQLGAAGLPLPRLAARAERWQPTAAHRHGRWQANLPPSPLSDLPPLQAEQEVTALAGQVLTLNGRGLADVTVRIGDASTRTDETGRFVLSGLEPGVQVLTVDGRSASRADARYGRYQTRVDISAGQTNVLGYVIWSSLLDPAGNAGISSPTRQERRITSPGMPGLELVIPADTVIRDSDGKIVTEVNITAIPTDRPPFPIPQLDVPVYFTIQPGGAKLTSVAGGKQQGARLIYPNFGNVPPGTRIDFWNYDTQEKGWYVYGQGSVSPDGRQIVPDADVSIYEFTGAMVASPSAAPREGPRPSGCGGGGEGCQGDANQPARPTGCAGDPVDCATGLFLHNATDLWMPDIAPLAVTRNYRPRDPVSRAFGIGANLVYDYFLVGDTSNYAWQDLVLSDGGRVHFVRISAGTSYRDAVYQDKSSGSRYQGAVLRWRGNECYWEMALKDGTQICFPESLGQSKARRAAATSWRDRRGNQLLFERDIDMNLTRVTSSSGRYLQFIYDKNNRITSASDHTGRTVRYAYDAAGRLVKVTDPDGQIESYTYDANHNMLTVVDKRANTMVSNVYDGNNRVIRQTYADGSTNSFVYSVSASGTVSQTDVTDERGNVTRMKFDAAGNLIALTRALGKSEQQNITVELDAMTGLMQSQTDAMGRKTAYTYDAKGNMLTRTELAGTADALTTSMTYTADFNQPASVTDALGHTWTMGYDILGNLTETIDPNGNRVTRAYNAAGRVRQVTDGAGNSVSFDHDGGDLARMTDPLRRAVDFYTDQTGRVSAATTAMGNRMSAAYDVQGRVTSSVDALGLISSHVYDANGNRTAFTDPKASTHRFSYDGRNRIVSETDPLGRSEKYVYDSKGNRIQKTDRKGQVTRYTYDALDRLKTVVYADSGIVALSYDQGNRITTMADSINGTLRFTYDSFDRVTRAESPRGSVSYTYYANGLRKSMSAPNMPTLTYRYDDGARLTGIEIAVGNASLQNIGFEYDGANRNTQMRYANGIVRKNSFDAGSQLSGITYFRPDGSVLGDLTYDYDEDGRLTRAGGSLARMALPEKVTSSGIGFDHALLQFGTQQFSYDKNGNMLSDGQLTYVWNARDQLTQIKGNNGVVIASFTYDALGRRESRSVRGVSQGYVYDGANIVQELNGRTENNSSSTNVKAGYVSGGIDEVFVRLAGGKMATYLTDALGSTIRLTDEQGGKLVDYTYDPYGSTTADAVADNPFQYTGRENDGTGLYYYRARYYAPKLGKFISRDPIGLFGGINVYQYADANPISKTDPYGLATYQCVRGLGQKPGGYVSPGNVTHHQYSCITLANGTAQCGGLAPSGNPISSSGRPTTSEEDYLDNNSCRKTQDDNQCFEQCLQSEWSKSRPHYSVIPGLGTQCQQYDDGVNATCRKRCGLK